jgi:single-strand DNA-binding protein
MTISGRRTRDPELRSLPSGDQVCNLRLAVDGMAPGRETGYIDVATFGKPGEAAHRVLSQGWLVAVDGRLEYRSRQTDDGQTRHAHQLIGSVEFLAAPAAHKPSSPRPRPRPNSQRPGSPRPRSPRPTPQPHNPRRRRRDAPARGVPPVLADPPAKRRTPCSITTRPPSMCCVPRARPAASRSTRHSRRIEELDQHTSTARVSRQPETITRQPDGVLAPAAARGALDCYLQMLAGPDPGGRVLEIRFALADGTMGRVFMSARATSKAATLIRQLSARTDVYVGVALRFRRSGGRDAIDRSHLLFIEIDSVDASQRLQAFA